MEFDHNPRSAVCAALNCPNDSNEHEKRSYFRFPKDPAQCRKWVIACQRYDLEDLDSEYLYKNRRVCSKHFENKMFLNDLKNRLHTHAIPTLFNFEDSSPHDQCEMEQPTADLAQQPEFMPGHQNLEENMNETTEDGSFSDFINGDPIEFESQGCHKMCRLCACLVQENKVVNMFTDSERNLIAKINRFLLYKVCPDDGLPPDICNTCVSKLEFCDRTVSSFITADKKLRELFEVDEKSEILMEIPIIDKRQENEDNECQDFETHLQKCDNEDIDDETKESFTGEFSEQKYLPLVTNCDEEYMLSEAKCLSPVSSQNELYVSEYLSQHSSNLESQDSAVKNEIFIEQIYEENLFKVEDYRDESNSSVNIYNGCNDDVNDATFELNEDGDEGEEYFSEETSQVNDVLEDEVYLDDEVQDFLQLQTEELELDSQDTSSEVCESTENKSVLNFQKQLEKNFEDTLMVCDICGKKFPDIYRLKCHKMTHSNDRARVCSICGKVFKNYYNMCRHMIIHTEKNFTCATCGRSFYSKTLLAQHMLSHSRERPYKCDICGVAYNRHSNMMQHRKVVHANDSKGKQLLTYQCNKCGRRLRSELTFKAHLAKHNGGISFFQCETCGKQYKTIELYRVHLRVHTGERPYMCEVCGKSFRGAYTLKQHSWQHRDDCRYSCPYCGRQFKQMYTLIVHKRIHTGEKPYACPICGRCFSQKNDMKKHTRTHDSKGTKSTVSSDTLFLS